MGFMAPIQHPNLKEADFFCCNAHLPRVRINIDMKRIQELEKKRKRERKKRTKEE